MIDTIKNKLINIEPEEVMEYARSQELDVQKLKDFREMAPHYDRIEALMEDYHASFARYSAAGGLTTGIGGFMTSVTFAGLDSISLSIQLYRLSQRFAILNGFDGNNPLHKDKMLNIFFEALSLNAVAQATMKHQLLQASAKAGTSEASENIVLKLIIKTGQLFGREISSEKAGRWVPVFGGLLGATVNYSFARKAGDVMKKAYKRAYFDTWHNTSGD